MSVTYEECDGIAVLTLCNPPVNSLDLPTRKALAEGLLRAGDAAAVRAVLLLGDGRLFCAGADLREFGTDRALAEPNLLSLIRLIEQCPRPVVAGLHGTAAGGGLELALACHHRVAARGATVALPEVKIGLLPGAGGTQRLPRALDVETALNLILGGGPVAAASLHALPGQRLFSALIDGDLRSGALSFAQQLQPGDRPLLRDLPALHAHAAAYFQFVRNNTLAAARHVPAPLKCVDAVEAAVTRPFEAGLALERELFIGLLHSPQAQALRHAFLAERAAARIADVPADTPVRPVQRAGVVGAGTMGSGIALAFLNAGIPVTLVDQQAAALERGSAAIRAQLESQQRKGRLAAAQVGQRLGLLHTGLSLADVAGADLVIEAVFEDLAVKEQVFRQLDAVLHQGAILASNTSTLDLDRIASFTRRPQDVVGLHFFSPAHVMKLLEVVRGRRTAADVLATAMALARLLRKTAVVARVCDGFIGNRMVEQYFRQAGFLLDEGCSPQQVDQAMERFGMAMGPLRMSDLAGNDISWAIRRRRQAEQPGLRYSGTADRVCEAGRFGQKAGRGWYDYPGGGRDAVPSPEVQQLIDAHRRALGIRPRAIGDDEIVQRLVYALVNEGARLLQEGIAARAGDIDVVYLAGYGFPAWRGGPLRHADSQGLFNVVQAMRRFARNPHDDAAFWEPAPLLLQAMQEGRPLSAARDS